MLDAYAADPVKLRKSPSGIWRGVRVGQSPYSTGTSSTGQQPGQPAARTAAAASMWSHRRTLHAEEAQARGQDHRPPRQ